MMRTAGCLGLAALTGALLAACGDVHQACYESGATAYPVHAPGVNSITFNWPKPYHPVRVYAEPVGALVANTTNGLQLWASALHCGELSLQMVTDSTTADIIVRNPTFFPPISATASFFADSVGACRGRTDILLDSTSTMLLRPIHSYVGPLGADSVATASCYHFVTAHELGHAIGLFSHSADAADLMYSTPRRTELSSNDRYTVQLLYNLSPTVVPSAR